MAWRDQMARADRVLTIHIWPDPANPLYLPNDPADPTYQYGVRLNGTNWIRQYPHDWNLGTEFADYLQQFLFQKQASWDNANQEDEVVGQRGGNYEQLLQSICLLTGIDYYGRDVRNWYRGLRENDATIDAELAMFARVSITYHVTPEDGPLLKHHTFNIRFHLHDAELNERHG